MKGKFVIFQGSDTQYYFHLKAPNGEIIGHSEGYTKKQGAKNGIASVKLNSPYDSRYTIFKGNDSQFYFNLKSFPNGEVILQSEGYVSLQGAELGKEAVKKYAPNADVEDKS